MTTRLYPATAHPGWLEWYPGDGEVFVPTTLGTLLARRESESTARVRLTPAQTHRNTHGTMHGGAVFAFVDEAMFAGMSVLAEGRRVAGVTIDAQVQFLAPAELDRPLDALVEITRETGRMVFQRGLLVQGEARVAAFTGLLRKVA